MEGVLSFATNIIIENAFRRRQECEGLQTSGPLLRQLNNN